MLTFQSLGDGNCLYNSEAVSLIFAYTQGSLDTNLKDQTFRGSLAGLLRRTSSEKIESTEKGLRAALDQFISQHSENGHPNWSGIQRALANPLRQSVVAGIRENPQIEQALRQAVRNSFEGFLQSGAEGIFEEYFGNMPAILAKAKEFQNDDQENKADRFVNWFFNDQGKDNGLYHYLHGKGGIGNDKVHAGMLEMQALSFLYQHPIYYRTPSSKGQYWEINGVLISQPKALPEKNGFGVYLEKNGNHFNALFEKTAASESLVKQNDDSDTGFSPNSKQFFAILSAFFKSLVTGNKGQIQRASQGLIQSIASYVVGLFSRLLKGIFGGNKDAEESIDAMAEQFKQKVTPEPNKQEEPVPQKPVIFSKPKKAQTMQHDPNMGVDCASDMAAQRAPRKPNALGK